MMGRAVTWFFALRPQYWLVTLFPLLIGASFSTVFPPAIILIVAMVVWGPIFSGATYLVNQSYDRESDRENSRTKNLPVATGEISDRAAKAGSALLFGFGGFLALELGLTFASLYLIGVLLSIAYSIPPIRLKTHSVLGVVTNSVGYGIVTPHAGWILTRELSVKPMLLGVPLALAIAAGYVYKTVEDIHVDEKFGTNTIAVELGKIRALKLSWILSLLAYASLLASSLVGWLNLRFVTLTPLGLIASLAYVKVLNSPKKNTIRRRGWHLSACLLLTLTLMFTLTRT